MRWLLRDGPLQFVLSTDRGAPFEGAELIQDSGVAATILRNLAYDSGNLRTLRQIHIQLTDVPNARSRAETVVIAELMGQVAARRLYLFEQGRTLHISYDGGSNEPAQELFDDDDAEALQAEPPPPPPEPAPSAAVLAQAAALQKAAHSGAPFCEE